MHMPISSRFVSAVLAGFATISSVASASEPVKARVDFLLRDGIQVEVADVTGNGGEVSEDSWSGSRTLVSTFPATRTWQSASITLLAQTDGQVTVLPMGEQDAMSGDAPVFILYDAFKASDDSLKNGSFESLDPHGDPGWWSRVDAGKLDTAKKSEVLSSVFLDGTRCIRTWHDSKYAQTIRLKANVPVTITFSYRLQ